MMHRSSPVPLRPLTDVLGGLNADAVFAANVDRALEFALQTRDCGNRVFFIGNGGSAAIASHMAADWLKNGGFAALAFNDAAALTCIANDCGYENVFAVPLQQHGRVHDMLIAISSSGESDSIINAVTTARRFLMKTVTLSGFKPSNRLRTMGDINFHVPSEAYGVVEIAHLAICHAILDQVIARVKNVEAA